MRRTTATLVRDNPDRASFTACVQVGPLHPRSRTRKNPGDRAVLNRPKPCNIRALRAASTLNSLVTALTRICLD